MADYKSGWTGSEIDAGIQAARKALPKSGGTMTGALTLNGTPTSDNQAATKKYVDDAAAKALPKSGGTMTGALTLNGAPTSNLHAATKKYVDDSVNNIALTPGEKGDPGEDGVSCTHSWNGTTLTVTSASGTSSANLKGDKGDKGDTGTAGENGLPGHTPVKGTDYWTEADKQEIVNEVVTQIPSGGTPNAVQYVPQELIPEQQSQARANISAVSGDWYLIADITTTEEIRSFYINTDMNGNPFACSKLAAYMILPEDLTGNTGTYFGASTHEWSRNGIMFNTSAEALYHSLYMESSKYGMFANFNYRANKNAGFISDTRDFFIARAGTDVGGPITQFLLMRTNEGCIFPVGTNLKVWGARA